MSGLRAEGLRFAGLGPFDLTLEPGQCIGLSGPSGAGKSLLLQALADLFPHQGELSFQGKACHDHPAPRWRQQIGYLPAKPQWWLPTPGAHFATPPALETWDLPKNILDQPVERLSTGEAQRLALARLLANQPKVLLLDEPTANLDADNQRRVEALIHDYRREYNAGVLWIGHDQKQLARVAEILLHMEGNHLQ